VATYSCGVGRGHGGRPAQPTLATTGGSSGALGDDRVAGIGISVRAGPVKHGHYVLPSRLAETRERKCRIKAFVPQLGNVKNGAGTLFATSLGASVSQGAGSRLMS
jgi:hypothetical protein